MIVSFLSQIFDLFVHIKVSSVYILHFGDEPLHSVQWQQAISGFMVAYKKILWYLNVSCSGWLTCVPPLQFAVTIGLQYVNTSLSTLVNPEDPESESEGWILEKTVGETFTDIMAKMKAMGKGTKVEEGGEVAVATVSWANPLLQKLTPLPPEEELRGTCEITTFFYQHLLRRHYLHTQIWLWTPSKRTPCMNKL